MHQTISLAQRFSLWKAQAAALQTLHWVAKPPSRAQRGAGGSQCSAGHVRPSCLFSPPQLVRMSSPGFHSRWWGLGHCHSTFYAPGHSEWTVTESLTGSHMFSVPLTWNLKYKKYRRYQILKYLPQFSWFNILTQKATSKSSMPCVFWILYLKYFKISNE